MIRDIFVVAAISDIHFGATKAEVLYEELKESFLNFIKNKKIDMIVICGDYYNSIVNLNTKTSHLSLLFMKELVAICKENGIKYIRIIQGTLSHDNNQLKNFIVFERDKDIDFKVILTVREEYLEEGLNILYVPEEYITNPIEYYKEYFSKIKFYDFVFGHGMFKETSFTTNDGESSISRAPIFDSSIFENICKGPVVFGHIHVRTNLRKQIHYTGSFSRWVYGEEEPKGFLVFLYDTRDSFTNYGFVKNKLAKKYDTIEVVHIPEDIPIKSFIKHLNSFKRDNLRIKLIINNHMNTDEAMNLSILREYYSNKTGFKLEIINNAFIEKEKETEEKVNKVLSEYDFVFDKKLPIEDKIKLFINKRYSKEISIEKIKDILYKDE